jgi:integrase
MLHRAFEVAIEWGLLQHNPVDGSSRIRIKRPEMQTYSPDEVNIFLKTCKEFAPQYHAAFTISLHCGFRRGELGGLKWKDVDSLTAFTGISVNRRLFVGKEGKAIFGEPKTEKSRAFVPLTPTASTVLKEHYEYTRKILDQMEITFNDDMLIFCHLDTGKHYSLNNLTRAWSLIGKKAGLKHIRLHDARHTMITIMLKKKIHPKLAQERGRHTSIRTTMDLYSHVLPSMQDEAVKQLDDAYKPEYNESINEDKHD